MRVLIGCEESQKVTGAYRKLNHLAFSCDIQETRGNPDWHYRGDVKEVIKYNGYWDLIILHPDCTALSLSGNRWYGENMPLNYKRIDAIEWTVDLWELAKEHSDRVVLENPMSVIFKYLNCDVQYIQPWQFGHGEKKKTGLALHNVERLKPTLIVDGRDERIFKMAPSPTRKRDRSETYNGIADAMASQWQY